MAALSNRNNSSRYRAYAADLSAGDGGLLPLHDRCLFRLGVYLGEIWYLSELADWLREKKINILVQIGLTRAPDLQDVPLITEFDL